MSLTTFTMITFLVFCAVLFFISASYLKQVLKKIREDPEALSGKFKESSVKSYRTMNMIFGGIAIAVILALALKSFLRRTKNDCLPKPIGSSKGLGKTGRFGMSTIGLVILAVTFAFFASLFIGNSVFFGKIKKELKKDETALPIPLSTISTFYYIQITLSVISILAVPLCGLLIYLSRGLKGLNAAVAGANITF